MPRVDGLYLVWRAREVAAPISEDSIAGCQALLSSGGAGTAGCCGWHLSGGDEEQLPRGVRGGSGVAPFLT